MATNDISTLLSQIESLISLSQCPQNRFLTYPPVISPVLPFRHRKFHHLGILFVRMPWFFMSELRRRSGWQQCPIVSRTRPWESAKPWLSASDIELSDSFFFPHTYICHRSVICHMSYVMCHMSYVIYMYNYVYVYIYIYVYVYIYINMCSIYM